MDDEWGITDGYFDVDGAWHATSAAVRDRIRASMGTPQPGTPMWFVLEGSTHRFWNPCRIELEDGSVVGPVDGLPAGIPIGYHRLVPVDGSATTALVVHPRSCPPLPRAWGAAVQIYALWSANSWGIGDLRDLGSLAASLREAGGRAVLVSPLHQPAPSIPQEDSPYYPSSRRAWNPLLIGVDEPPPPPLRCSEDELIDRDAAWAAKRARLEAMFAESGATDASPGRPLSAVAVWNALCDAHGPDWRSWPDDVRRFEPVTLADRVADDGELAARAAFHEWTQHIVGEQLDAVTSTGVDVIGDLAIGISPNGADAWEFQDLIALDMRIGAPPDPFNAAGQDWGIPPFVPWRLRAAGYGPFIDTIRACLRGVQGLRMDHVMGLFRQFWIPEGGRPADGAYVTFPADELLAIICLEATRAGAYVVGEDLGTVAEGVRQQLAACNIAGTKVLWFEQASPDGWPENSLATITTHDLPTIAGVQSGRDGDDEQRARLRDLVGARSDDAAPTLQQVIDAAHDALLQSPARLRLVAMDDITAAVERPNHPGTTDQPNWRRRLPVPIDRVTVAERRSVEPG